MVKKIAASVIGISVMAAGLYLYKTQTLKERRALLTKAVPQGGVVVEDESHYWKVRPRNESFTALEVELFIENKSEVPIVGNLVFTAEILDNGIDREWMDAFIDVALKDGFTSEQLQSDEFAKMARQKSQAIATYLKRGRKFLPNHQYEPIDSMKQGQFTFSFRKPVSLKPNEVQRIVHKPDFPYGKMGYYLNTKVTGIEFE